MVRVEGGIVLQGSAIWIHYFYGCDCMYMYDVVESDTGPRWNDIRGKVRDSFLQVQRGDIVLNSGQPSSLVLNLEKCLVHELNVDVCLCMEINWVKLPRWTSFCLKFQSDSGLEWVFDDPRSRCDV